MPVEQSESHTEPTAEDGHLASQTVGSVLMSLAFWCTLLTAAVMYASVALSPKLADWMMVREQYAANGARQAELEDEADYLERVAAALKSDPTFAKRLVDAAQGQGPASSGFIAVAGDLQFTGETPEVRSQGTGVQPKVARLVFHLASHQQHRFWLLAGACGLTVLSFSLLNDAGSAVVYAGWDAVRSRVRKTLSRYLRAAPSSDS